MAVFFCSWQQSSFIGNQMQFDLFLESYFKTGFKWWTYIVYYSFITLQPTWIHEAGDNEFCIKAFISVVLIIRYNWKSQECARDTVLNFMLGHESLIHNRWLLQVILSHFRIIFKICVQVSIKNKSQCESGMIRRVASSHLMK